MVVYIEYVFIENLLFDFALLSLTFLLCKTKIVWWKMLISACVGGVFAVVYPLILLPQILLIFLKIAVGFLLCFIPFPCLKIKNAPPMYALNVLVFFFLTFLYGGALTALFSEIFPQKTPVFLVVLGFAALSVLTVFVIQKIYQKRTAFQHIYPCKICYKQRKISLLGYMDSGNLAQKNGLPVCFISPDIFYEVFGEEILFSNGDKKSKGGGQVCDEMVISTMSGEKKVQIYLAELQVKIAPNKKTQTQAYFCSAANMLNREYKILLNAEIIRDCGV